MQSLTDDESDFFLFDRLNRVINFKLRPRESLEAEMLLLRSLSFCRHRFVQKSLKLHKAQVFFGFLPTAEPQGTHSGHPVLAVARALVGRVDLKKYGEGVKVHY